MVHIFPVLLILFSFFSTSIARAAEYTATAITFEPMVFDTSEGKWVSMDKIQKSGSTLELNLNHGSIYGLKVIIEGKQGKPRWFARLHATIECNTCFYQGKYSKHKIKILPAATIPLLFAPPRLEIFIPRVAARTWPSATMIHSKAVPSGGSAKPCDHPSKIWPGLRCS